MKAIQRPSCCSTHWTKCVSLDVTCLHNAGAAYARRRTVHVIKWMLLGGKCCMEKSSSKLGIAKKIKHDALSWAEILPPSASRRQLWPIITKVAPLCPQRPQLLWPGQALPSTEVRRGNRIKCDRLARRPKGIIGEGPPPWVVQTGKHPSLGWSTEGIT